MPIELELKVKVESLSLVQDRLTELGASHQAELEQRDSFFDRSDRSLLHSNCGLRIRQVSGSGQNEVLMCYKGARVGGPFKQREELEFTVGSYELASQLLAALGYKPILEVVKHRSLWHFKGCDVCLDQVEGLGVFVEIEGPDEGILVDVQHLLGLDSHASIGRSYASMLAKKRGE